MIAGLFDRGDADPRQRAAARRRRASCSASRQSWRRYHSVGSARATALNQGQTLHISAADIIDTTRPMLVSRCARVSGDRALIARMHEAKVSLPGGAPSARARSIS